MSHLRDLWDGPKTVGDFIETLSSFPLDWPVSVATPAGGGIGIEHRERNGQPFVAIFGKNGGRFGENPLTEDEYRKQSEQFLNDLKVGKRYTSIHGDHRTYHPSMGSQATCYGTHYDRRIIERMVREGLIERTSVDLDRVAHIEMISQ
jgi:pyocin large subunit-like protein